MLLVLDNSQIVGVHFAYTTNIGCQFHCQVPGRSIVDFTVQRDNAIGGIDAN